MAGASDNGGRPPGGGPPDDLPDFPEEWGVIVIPDDLSELADEVEAVRAELHTGPPLTGWQRFVRRPAVRRLRKATGLFVRTPALIVSMAILVTVASLFASAWPGPPRQPASQRTSGTPESHPTEVPALELIGADGKGVSIAGRPAVLLLVDGCDCAKLLADTVAAAPPNVAVLAISTARRSAPATAPGTLPTSRTPAADGKGVIFLQDRTDTLRDDLHLGLPDGTAAVILKDGHEKIIRISPRTSSVEVFRPDLLRL
ncbi:hypothetical protein Aph02nite_58950 [Actinoplanes philippinensis]|uniref:Uncharacterized protein n=1 Tax=Actinoplanes philippinensis TaxID=35752 RepID=A0A1I2JBU0_9ACTN|nr:hypothetical protein [Actinoplanes philippinensis]GIE79945.1 hypothetical protein Aph02nite_58950 [Actinoplanes philippinensis]SFF52302.1 hypothetical protein SAMN05421541_112104 [Actinoplanes philippinensis]